MYTTTISFPVIDLKNGSNVQIVMVFNTNLSGSNRTWNAADYGLKLVKLGSLKYSYNLDDALLVPGSFDCDIFDPQGILRDFIWGTSLEALATDKRPEISLYLNSALKIKGRAIMQNENYSDSSKLLKLKIAPSIDILNRAMVYDEDGNPTTVSANYVQGNWYKITDLIQDIFKFVNSSISYSGGSLYIYHDWTFLGQRYSPTNDYAVLKDIIFTELSHFIDPLYFDSSKGMHSLADILRKFAQDWCCFAGLLSEDIAFFKKVFCFNENYIQTLNVLDHELIYENELIDYVEIKSTVSPTDPGSPYKTGSYTALEDRRIVRDVLTSFWGADDLSGGGSWVPAHNLSRAYFVFRTSATSAIEDNAIYSNNGATFKAVGYDPTGKCLTALRINGGNPQNSGVLTKVSGTGPSTVNYSSYANGDGSYYVYRAKDKELFPGLFKNHGTLLSKFWMVNRGDISKLRVDKFVCAGVDYDFLKDFYYQGGKYQPIDMEIDFNSLKTTIKALWLGVDE